MAYISRWLPLPTAEQRLVFALGAFLASEGLGQLEFQRFQCMEHILSLSDQERRWVTIHVDIEDGHAATTYHVVNELMLVLGRTPEKDPDLWTGFESLTSCLHRAYQHMGHAYPHRAHSTPAASNSLNFVV